MAKKLLSVHQVSKAVGIPTALETKNRAPWCPVQFYCDTGINARQV
ncbi:hypothetical protein SFMTTN_1984 [Sulfuriferula multivorans]|uniref:Uncharacterized protein n=1 Tax=Sulfuriferula multivorans TaxID=1559896 RepID=A0A401JEW6_9PROT|nr:hypothetical protein SFMTTN_1984 [Sulfuriferula multivorans]